MSATLEGVLRPPSPARYHEALARSAKVRRFYERWVADPSFRTAFVEDPAEALAAAHLSIVVDDVASLLDPSQRDPSPGVRAMWAAVQEKDKWVRDFYWDYAVPDDPRIRDWRERQIARQRLDISPYFADSNIHSSFAVELAKGCTGGCWFCAVSAEKFEGYWPHTEENAEVWRAMLDALRDRLGPAASSGFLYWATDPLDNPDYEQFCLDFHDRIGIFPPTTTAMPLRDVARTKRLLAMSDAYGSWSTRFSILSVKLMDRVEEEFSEEDLRYTECMPVNRSALFAYGNAGRFRDRALKNPALVEEQKRKIRAAPWWSEDEYGRSDDYPNNSICCISGFLVNVITRNIQLISPCTADDSWPLGYYIYGERNYDSAEDFARGLDELIDEHMPTSVRPDDRPVLHNWLGFEEIEYGFRLRGRFGTEVEVRDVQRRDAVRSLGRFLQDGAMTTRQLMERMAGEYLVSSDWVQQVLDRLLSEGVLDESPCR